MRQITEQVVGAFMRGESAKLKNTRTNGTRLWLHENLIAVRRIKVVDNFVWMIVNDIAIELFATDFFALYIIYPDGSESLIEDEEEIVKALLNGLEIGVEVGDL